MPDLQHLLIFIAAGWLLNLTPGPDVLYIVTNSLRSGARAGVVAGLGITSGCFVHVFAAALGVTALLAASATAFTVLKWLGAAYLLWMGVRMLFSRASALAPDLPAGTGMAEAGKAGAAEPPRSLKAIWLGGFWTNVLNPKVALFFLAFVPQFVAPDAPNKALAFALLGIVFNLNAIPVNSAWALGAAWMARRVGAVQAGMHWLDRAAGALFIGFGIKLALSDNPAH